MAPSSASAKSIPLAAVILVARSRPGPHLVFHYPANAQKLPAAPHKQADDDSDSEEEPEPPLQVDHDASKLNVKDDFKDNANPDDNLVQHASGDQILGYSEETLRKLLSPGCWSDRKKFEICIDGLTFIGHPMHAGKDGNWAKKHSHDDHITKQEPRPITPTPVRKSDEDTTESSIGITVTKSTTPDKAAQDFTHVPDSFDSRLEGHSLAASMNSGSSTSAYVLPEELTMFNLVFVTRSSRSDDAQRAVSDLYEHVAKKLSKAIHHCQKHDRYLGMECKKLLSLKTKATLEGSVDPEAIGEQMVNGSELAWALKEVYEKITAGEVAGIRLNGNAMSLQIPPSHDIKQGEEPLLTSQSAILLLEDKDIMLKELAHPDASPLAYFIREHTPTTSLHKLATNLSIPIEDILALARHLILWRKARPTSPLNPRNTYIVGRYAPLDRLQSFYIADYLAKFPVSTTLPLMLKLLSGKPIKYGMLIPSREHRVPYMDILAYLVQHRFVEQLKTYGWLQAPPSIMAKAVTTEEKVNENRKPLSVANLLSPQMRPIVDDDTVSVSSERTTVPIATIEKSDAGVDTTAEVRNGNSSLGDNNAHAATTIIADPRDLSSEDTQRLLRIREVISDVELSERLASLLQHFDGTSAFEDIAAIESLKRSKVESWMELLQREGLLMTFRSV